MSSIGHQSTAIGLSTQGDSVTTSIESILYGDSIWKPRLISQPHSATFSLGAVLFGVMLAMAMVSVALIIYSMYLANFFISTKFALFLFLFFTGFSVELLYSRKLNRNV